MRKFQFTLQKVLDYRRHMEEQAKRAYQKACTRYLEAEVELGKIHERRDQALNTRIESLECLKATEAYLIRLDDEEGAHCAIMSTLKSEEQKAHTLWKSRHQDLEAIKKLYERKRQEWLLEENHLEQKNLHDWGMQRQQVV